LLWVGFSPLYGRKTPLPQVVKQLLIHYLPVTYRSRSPIFYIKLGIPHVVDNMANLAEIFPLLRSGGASCWKVAICC
jgi:hypothetical protein